MKYPIRTGPMYEKLSREEWEEAWPSSGPEVQQKSTVDRAREFGIDITLLVENLRRSATERLIRAQRAAASLFSLRKEIKGKEFNWSKFK